MINLCVTVTRRQDLLPGCLQSAFAGTLLPDRVYLIDQAWRPDLLEPAIPFIKCPVEIIDLYEKRGCEGSAVNWYLNHVSEQRVIAHEDVVFAPDSLAKFVAAEGDFLIDSSLGVMSYRDRCWQLAGWYDTAISPNFFTYVDVDYEDRLAQFGIHPTVVTTGVQHLCNGTRKALAGKELDDYNQRVRIAATNYEKKWNRPVTPGGHTIGRGAWRRTHMWSCPKSCGAWGYTNEGKNTYCPKCKAELWGSNEAS